ncbi:mas-related G-protein coupled receptor member A-like [Petaurus breviceps papuanus]|uniref:mas-related G-protein coupled receptor member A-like n=1 Tax=Petaurus breviceps papuanus TaxID=3040969 RepID=UPI0036DDEA24
MAASPTPEQWDCVYDNATERSANESSVVVALGKLLLNNWMEIPSLLVALVGLVGNSAVLWLLGFHIPRNPFSVYILNLAAADALFLCSYFLVSMHLFVNYLHDSFMHGLLKYVTYTFYTVGLSLLAAISTERCLSVLFPIWYRCHRPKHTSPAVCAALWALGGLICVTGVLSCLYDPHHFCRHFFIIELAWFIVFTCVLCVSSLTLLLRVQCSSQRRQPPRLYLLVLLTVLVFLLCGLPLEIEDFIRRFKKDFMPEWLSQLLACVNSSANPLIYFFLGSHRHKRRAPLKVVLQRALGDEQELGTEITDTLHTNRQETSF